MKACKTLSSLTPTPLFESETVRYRMIDSWTELNVECMWLDGIGLELKIPFRLD